MYNSSMRPTLKRIALITGFAALAISIYFSYDGFDQSVSGSNSGYTALAIIMGFTMAIVVSVVQFIFGTAYDELNWTLIIAGIGAYVYSIYTNKLGFQHVLGADEFMSWASALFLDIYPEPAIAWALGESLIGDMFGNIGKAIFGSRESHKYTHTEKRVDVSSQRKHGGFQSGHQSDYQIPKSDYKPKYKPNFTKMANNEEEVLRMLGRIKK